MHFVVLLCLFMAKTSMLLLAQAKIDPKSCVCVSLDREWSRVFASRVFASRAVAAA